MPLAERDITPDTRHDPILARRIEAGRKQYRSAPAVVRGLEELEMLFSEAKGRFTRGCIFCVTVTFCWPLLLLGLIVAWPGLLIILYLGDQETRRWLVQHSLGALGIVTLFLIYFGIPLLALQAQPSGLDHFTHMLGTGEVGMIELCFYFASFLLLLVLVIYAWVVYESVSLEVAVSLQSRTRFLKTHWQEELAIPDAEKLKVFGVNPGTPVRVDDLLRVLSRYPGWKGSFDTQNADLEALMIEAPALATQRSQEEAGQDTRRSSASSQKRTAEGAHLKHIDAVVMSSLNLLQPGESAVVFKSKMWHFLRNLLVTMEIKETVTTLIGAALRAVIPRLFVWLYLGGQFLPGNPVDKIVVFTFMITTFVVSSCWLLLFNVVRKQYKHNIDQMLLVTSLVSVTNRHDYMSKVLQVDPDDEEHLQLAQGLPFLDLSNADNTRIWWAIREYAIVDSLDERVDLEVVLGVAMVYLLMMTLYLILDVFLSGHLTAFTLVSCFDLVVVGSLVLFSLLGCVEVNEMLRSHTRHIMRARHALWNPEAKIVGMADAEATEFLLGQKESGGVNPDTLRLHGHLIEKIYNADTLQTIFGYEVTSTNVAQLVVAIGCALASAFFSISKAHQYGKLTAAAASFVRVVATVDRTHATPAAFLGY